MLSIADKVGQMMLVGFDGTKPPAHILEWLASGRIGGVYLFARNIESPAQVKALIDDCHAAAKYPILVGIDQEGGIVARLRQAFMESPGAMALGAAGDIQLAEEIAEMMGRELAALGINWNLAPVADIAHRRENPSVSTRSVGRDSQLVSEIVIAQIRGYQRAGVAATVKHFPGLGNTIIDTHDALAKVSGALNYLYQEDLLPFRAAIDAGVACVMLTHVMFEELDSRYPATLSPRIVGGLLREELGYSGAVCTDCMEMNAITDGFGAGESAVLAVLAGVDMPLFSHSRARQEAAYEAVLAAVASGRIPLARIDQSVGRIAALKSEYALSSRPAIDVVGGDQHRSLAAKAARAGTALVKLRNGIPVGSSALSVSSIEFSSQKVSDAVEASSQLVFSRYLSRRLPKVACHVLDPSRGRRKLKRQIDSILGETERLILLTRNAHLQASQLALAQSIIDRAGEVILICARDPYDASVLRGADTIICTHGDSVPSLEAAVDAICGDYLPTGKMTVDL